ncbi:Uncharacterised protein [uncultured archaeon]|nr:Uncharacterised protein [uncultured archaeon]
MRSHGKGRTDGRMKGYILSLMMLMLMSVISIYAADAVAQKQQAHSLLQKQFYTEKTAYFLDDMAQDVRYVLRLDYPSNSAQLVFRENLAVNKSQFLANYSSFLGNFSQTTNTNVSFAYSDPLGIEVSNGLTYLSNFTNQRVDLYNMTGGPAAVAAYYISINSSQERSAVLPISFVGSGTYVWINYTDLAKPAKSFVDSGFVDPTALSTYEIKYGAGRSVFLSLGLVDGRQNAYRLEQSGILAVAGHSLEVNCTAPGSLYAFYTLPLNITLPGSGFTGRLPAR